MSSRRSKIRPTGAWTLVAAPAFAGPGYDALLHALSAGFVCSMIFGHAPIIFLAILRAEVRYSAGFYVPLDLLHGTVALRIAADLLEWAPGRSWGGLVNAVTLVLFLGNTVASLRTPKPVKA